MEYTGKDLSPHRSTLALLISSPSFTFSPTNRGLLLIAITPEHLIELCKAFSHLTVQISKIGQDFFSGRVLNTLVFDLGVLVKAEVVIVIDNLLLRNQETLVRTLTFCLIGKIRPSVQDIRNVVVLFVGIALVIEGEAVALHVVHPNIISATGVGLSKHKNSRADP